VPESKYGIIRNEINDLLKKYENPNQTSAQTYERQFSETPLENKAEMVIPERIVTSNYIEEKSNIEDDVKKEKIKALQDMADLIKNEGASKPELFTKKKINIDEEYEFEVVKTLPDIDDQVYVDKKQIAMYDKYDIGVFYVKWEGRNLKFVSKREFDRFCTDNLIK